jgi:hypothetical protein
VKTTTKKFTNKRWNTKSSANKLLKPKSSDTTKLPIKENLLQKRKNLNSLKLAAVGSCCPLFLCFSLYEVAAVCLSHGTTAHLPQNGRMAVYKI